MKEEIIRYVGAILIGGYMGYRFGFLWGSCLTVITVIAWCLLIAWLFGK